jgi:HAMP domain-containing protein
MSIRAKLIVAIAASMAALAVATGVLVRVTEQRGLETAAQQAIASAGASFAALERADVEKLDATLRALSADWSLVDPFAARDRAKLLAAAGPVFSLLRQNHGVTHMYFIEPEPSRKVFLRVHRKDEFGDVVHRATLTRAIDTLSFGAGKEFGMNAFALRVVRPWYGRDGALVGFVELAEEMDHFVARLKQQTGDEYGLMIEKVFLDRAAWAKTQAGKRNGWDDRARSVLVNATVADERELVYDGDMSSVPDGGLYLEEDEHDGRYFVHGIVPVKDAAGRRVGGLFVLHDLTALRTSLDQGLMGIYGVLAILAALLTFLLVALVNGVVLRRLQRMAHELDVLGGRFSVGDYDVRVPRPTGADEVGRFEAALGAFVQRVIELLREAGRGKKAG